MRIDDEYRLQTEEGAEWEKDYRSRLAAIRDDASRMSQLRNERLLAGGRRRARRAQAHARREQDAHGRSSMHWGQDEPSASRGRRPGLDPRRVVGHRVGGEEVGGRGRRREPDRVRASAEARGRPDQGHPRQLRGRAGHAAAEPTPQTDEGKAAQRAMKTRVATDDERLNGLFQDVVAHARVFQGGGAEVTTSTLRDAVETAADRSLIRLFPKFAAGDNAELGQGRHQGARRRPRRARGRRPPRRADHQRRLQGGARRDQRRRHQGRRPPEALRRAAVRLAEGRRQRRDPHAARRRQHPGRAGRQGRSPGRRSCRRPRSARSRSTRRTSRRPSASGSPSRACSPPPASPTRPGRKAPRSRRCSSGSRTSPAEPAARRRCPSRPTPTTSTPSRPRRQPAVPRRRRRPRPPERGPRTLAGGRPAAREARGRVARSPAPPAPRRGPADRRQRSSPPSRAIRDGRQLLDDPDPDRAAARRAHRRAARRAQASAPSSSPSAQRAAVDELEAWDEWGKLDADDRESHRRGREARRRRTARYLHGRQAARSARRHPAERVAGPDQPRARAGATRRGSAPPSSSSPRA